MNKVKLKSGSLQAKAEEISASPPLRLPLSASRCPPPPPVQPFPRAPQKLVNFSNQPFPKPTKTAPKPLFLRSYLNEFGTDQVRMGYD